MSNFKGTRRSPYNVSWEVVPEQGPDKTLAQYGDISDLRSKSHQLIRDDLIIAGMQQAYLNQIIAQGPAIYSDSKNKFQKEQFNKILKEVLKSCDMSGTKSFNQILEEIVSCSFADGDVLINLPIDSKRTGVQTVVELIEAYRVETPGFLERDPEMKERVRLGVQYDTEGRVEGYWVKKADRADYRYSSKKEDYNFYPVFREADGYRRKVTFLFKAPANSRPLASRQYPLITPAISLIKDLGDFNEATIIGARVAACFSAFIKTKNPNAAMKSMTTTDGEAQIDPVTRKRYTKLQPATVMYLEKDEEVDFAAPNRPGDNTDTYTVRCHKLISMCFRIPYVLAFLDVEKTTYSSLKGAVLDTGKLIARWRGYLNNTIDWIVSTWGLEAISKNLIRGSLSTLEIKKRWPAFGILDKEKEARGDKIDLNNGITSKRLICSERGIDYEDVKKDRLQEALEEVELQAAVLIRQKELSEKHDIVFPDSVSEEDRDTSGSRREGEQEGSDLDEEDAKERRKEDGNW